MAPRQTGKKPGAHRAPQGPDRIITLEPRGEGLTLLPYVLQSLAGTNRTTVKDYLKHGHIKVNQTVTRQFDTPVAQGDTVSINTTRPWQTLDHHRLKPVYEDDDIIVVEKGYGLLSMGAPGAGKPDTAYSLLRDYVKRVDPRQKIFIVHRLDQHTSGLMMFAKSPRVKDTLQHNWNNLVLDRRYVAVVEGRVEGDSGVCDTYLAENIHHIVYNTGDAGRGKRAVTRWRVLKRGTANTLMELSLDTGRKNQIRVHMSGMGHPIAGDRKYGASSSGIGRLALHARSLRFIHPVTRQDMSFTSPLPPGFNKIV